MSVSATGSPELLRSVRASFILNGSSIASWCRENRITRSYAYRALQGETNGPAAVNLRARLLNASQAEAT